MIVYYTKAIYSQDLFLALLINTYNEHAQYYFSSADLVHDDDIPQAHDELSGICFRVFDIFSDSFPFRIIFIRFCHLNFSYQRSVPRKVY